MPQSQMPLTRKAIEDVLKSVQYPGYSRDILSFGLVKDIEITGRDVHVKLEGTSKDTTIPKKIEQDVQKGLEAIEGIGKVEVSVYWSTAKAKGTQSSEKSEPLLTQIRVKIAVASGKGGVGKSTVAVHLALALVKQGLKVGLLDLDIYGPSLPMMLGLDDRPHMNEANKIIPLEKFGLRLMSIGFMIDQDTPMVWRGPMVHQAAEQFMRDVDWGELDVLIVDLPPGTGDAQMTLSQRAELSGAVIVSTPQDLALIDARKGVRMFQMMGVPIMGIIENMSTFVCPHCGTVTPIFGEGGAEQTAKEMSVPILGRIPILPMLREISDAGTPLEGFEESPEVREVFENVSKAVMEAAALTSKVQ